MWTRCSAPSWPRDGAAGITWHCSRSSRSGPATGKRTLRTGPRSLRRVPPRTLKPDAAILRETRPLYKRRGGRYWVPLNRYRSRPLELETQLRQGRCGESVERARDAHARPRDVDGVLEMVGYAVTVSGSRVRVRMVPG